MTPETFLRWLFAVERPPAIDDWGELERWLDVLHAAPLAYGTIRRRGEESLVPAAVLGRLKQRYLHQTALSLELLGATRELTAKLSAAGVPSRLLKGGALFAAGVYEDPGIRYTQDIDILIAPRDAKKAGTVLESLGYVTSGIGGAPKHLPPYYRGRVAVELHEWAYWDARGNKVGLAELDGESLLAPTVVHLVHHLFFTSPFEPWLLVRTLQDLRAADDAAALSHGTTLELSDGAGVSTELSQLRELLTALEASRATSRTATKLLESVGRFDSSGSRGATAHYYLRLVRHAPAWYARDAFREAVFPDSNTLAAIYGLDARSPALPVLYALRPFHLGVRILQALLERRPSRR